MKNIEKTMKSTSGTVFFYCSLSQRQELLRGADVRYLAIALPGVSAAAEKVVLEALSEDARKTLENSLPYTHNLRVIDVTQAQENLLKLWGLVEPGEVLKPLIPETDDIIVTL